MATVIGSGIWEQLREKVHGAVRARTRTDHPEDILARSVIPRLMVPGFRPDWSEVAGKGTVCDADVTALVPIAVYGTAHELLEQVESVMRRGIAAETVFVELLAPVARWLGVEWEEDRLDFVQVSMALWRLQEVLRQVAAGAGRIDGPSPRSALFAPMPGDQHSFGAAMVQECFALAGWDAELLVGPSAAQINAAVAEQRYDLLGLTLTCDCPSGRLASLVRAIRSVSKNPQLCILIGGRAAIERPELATLAGADGTATDAGTAVRTAERMVDALRLALPA